MSDKSKKLIKFGVIGFLGFLILLVLIVSIGSCSKGGGTDNTNQPGEYTLVVYKSDVGLCFEKSAKCDKSPFSIQVKTETAKIVSIEKDSLYLLYEDDGKLNLYDVNKKQVTELDLDTGLDYYNIIVDSGNAVGIVYGKGKVSENNYSSLGYYSISSEEKMYENKYSTITKVNSDYLIGKNSNSSSLLNIKKEEVILERNNSCITYDIKRYGSYDSYLLYNSCDKTYEILNHDRKSIFTNLKENTFSLDLSGNVYILEGTNSVKIYGNIGMFMKNATFEGEFVDLIINYVVVKKDNKLYLKDLNRNSDLILLGDWSSSYKYYYNSDYYPENYLFSASEKKAGIYILFTKSSNAVSGYEYYVDVKNNNKVNTLSVTDYREALKKA